MPSKVTRRRFLRGLAAVAGGTVLAACTPQVVEKVVDRPVIQTVVVDRAVEVERVSTVIVEKAVEVEKKVVETVVVEKAVQVEVEKRVVETIIVDRPVDRVVKETVIVEREVEKVVTAVPDRIKPIELTLFTIPAESWINYYAPIIEEFKENTGIQVISVGKGQPFSAHILPALAAGTPPDLTHGDGGQMAGLFADDTMLTLNDVFDESGYKKDEFWPCSLEPFDFLGKLKMMPIWAGSGGPMYFNYRKDFFDEEGLEYPEEWDGFDTWQDLWEVAKKLTKTDASGEVVRWGWDSMGPIYSGNFILSGMAQLDAPWFDEASGEFLLTSDACIRCIQEQWLDPVFTYGCAWDDAHKPEAAMWEKVQEGACVMQFASFAIQAWRGDPEKEALLGWAMLPGMVPKPRKQVGTGPWGIGAVRGTPEEQRKWATRFCFAHLTQVGRESCFKNIGVASAVTSSINDPAFVAQKDKDLFASLSYNNTVWGLENGLDTKFVGWEWGKADTIWWLDFNRRCGGEEGQALCERTGTFFSGKLTAEQLAEQWQERATNVRKEFYASIGMDV